MSREKLCWHSSLQGIKRRYKHLRYLYPRIWQEYGIHGNDFNHMDTHGFLLFRGSENIHVLTCTYAMYTAGYNVLMSSLHNPKGHKYVESYNRSSFGECEHLKLRLPMQFT